MKSQYVNELKSGQLVKEKFILSKKWFKSRRDGSRFALLEFSDRTGSIEGIAWNVEQLDSVSTGDFVFITGNVNEYQQKLQIVINSISQVSETEIDPADFLPQAEQDITEIMAEINKFCSEIKNENLKELVDSFFKDEEFVKKFRASPGAKKLHHAYLGGLAVHTLNILKLLSHIETVYPFCNKDLLITATLLHDIGKIYEYTYKNKIDISTQGKMLGHIVIGYEMVADHIDKLPDFPQDLKLKILHMILSHHGEFEWGSPKLPVFPEALILHFLDNLDSKVDMMAETFKKNRGKEKEWSDYHPYFEREIYLHEGD